MADASQLSPRGAVLVGVLCGACGIVPILGGLGMIPMRLTEGTPPWVAVAVGLVFVLGGAAVVVGHAIAGGAEPDGDLPAGTRFGVRLTQYLLGLGIIGLMIAITGWIAFGPGERHFSTALAWPFVPLRWASSETTGRTIFGVGTALLFLMLISLMIIGAGRFRKH